MNFLDRTPGGFIFVANAILYAVVLVEIWMLTTGSIAAMVATMVLIIVAAGLLCRWVLNLMGPEDHAVDFEPRRSKANAKAKAPAPAPAPVARPAAVQRRRARPVASGRPVAH
jgi:hypothetical protein